LDVVASINVPDLYYRRFLMLISVTRVVSGDFTPINRLFAANIEFRGQR
jgi:hypothetical protein